MIDYAEPIHTIKQPITWGNPLINVPVILFCIAVTIFALV